MGTLFGLLSSWMMKKCKALAHEPVFETSAILFIAYTAYIVAEIIAVSGVITILACAIVMAHYTWYNCSVAAQHGTSLSFELLGHATESFVFSYLGLCAFSYGSIHWSIPFIFLTLGIVMAGRFLHVFVMSALLKLFMRHNFTISLKEQGIIWLGGAIRGAVAFALIIGFVGDHSKMLVTTTLGLVGISTVVFGAVMPLWCWLLSPSDDVEVNEGSMYISR
jgi:sodium/hydrogen exchanger-like protein 6/7